MNKLIGTFLMVAICATLLVSYASADHHKPEDQLTSNDNVAEAELKLDSILDGLRVRRAAQGGQGGGGGQSGGGRRGPPSDGQGGQRGGQGGQGGGGQSGQNSGGN